MKQLIKKIIPKKFHRTLDFIRKPFIQDYKKSYSQSGEDMILNTILCDVRRGFYVDVGANNPTIQSNTHFFYKKGWYGINIDALPGSMKIFNRMRPRDINLEVPISDKEEKLIYFMFSPSFYNSFLEESAVLLKDKLIGKKKLTTKTLSWVLDNYSTNREIDFMTIDVEGLVFQVLKSNNWIKYRPKVLVIELFANEIESIQGDMISTFLEKNGYSLYCFSPTNIFYIENEFSKVRFQNRKTFANKV
jgi:FkbM family methyltransferase